MTTKYVWTDADGLVRNGGRRAPETSSASTAVQDELSNLPYGTAGGGRPGAAELGLDGPTYTSRSETDRYIVNGVEQTSSRLTQATHDLFATSGSLLSPLTLKSNLLTVQHGQKLLPIPGAVSAPFWTDPGAVTLSYTSDNIPAEVKPHLSYENDSWVYRSLPGYGDASGARRRVQMAFPPISGRRRVVWDLSFMIHPDDDTPHSSDPLYTYPFLLWQLKAAPFPCWTATVENNPDGSCKLFMAFKWSSDPTDASTYRRQWNEKSTGSSTAQSNSIRFFEKTFQRGEWVDFVIETYLDERDITAAAGGKGYLKAWVNKEQVLAYTGPTLTIKDTDGNPPPPHSWYIGIYRTENAVPAALKELDLNRAVDPAPFTRALAIRRARLIDLGEWW